VPFYNSFDDAWRFVDALATELCTGKVPCGT
jgi:kynureninase